MNVRSDLVVLLATDSDAVMADIDAAVIDGHTRLERVRNGEAVRSAVLEFDPDLVICDLQIGNMGGVATTLDLRLEEGAGRLAPRPVLLLLDRVADEFIARRSGADAWLTKPIEMLEVRRLVWDLLEGAGATSRP